jgi:hypothetical protein
MDVFPMGPPRDYISSPVVNQKSVVEREGERSKFLAVKEEGLAQDWLWVVVIDCN